MADNTTPGAVRRAIKEAGKIRPDVDEFLRAVEAEADQVHARIGGTATGAEYRVDDALTAAVRALRQASDALKTVETWGR
jgi:hypothetical protein